MDITHSHQGKSATGNRKLRVHFTPRTTASPSVPLLPPRHGGELLLQHLLGQIRSPHTSHSCFLLLFPLALISLSPSSSCHFYPTTFSFPLCCSHPPVTLTRSSRICPLLYFLSVLPCHPSISPLCSECSVEPLLAFVTLHSFALMEEVSLK